jgi:DNA-binding transcriptional regulator YiaG
VPVDAGTRAVFVHGFAKNATDNIEKDELAALKKLAAERLAYDDKTLARVVAVRPLKPREIRALRLREGASQAVFARYLNVTTGVVSQWERGEKRPQGASLKLLSLVAKNGLQAVA